MPRHPLVCSLIFHASCTTTYSIFWVTAAFVITAQINSDCDASSCASSSCSSYSSSWCLDLERSQLPSPSPSSFPMILCWHSALGRVLPLLCSATSTTTVIAVHAPATTTTTYTTSSSLSCSCAAATIEGSLNLTEPPMTFLLSMRIYAASLGLSAALPEVAPYETIRRHEERVKGSGLRL